MSDLRLHPDQAQPCLDNPDVEVLVLTAPPDVQVGEAVDGPELLGGEGRHPARVLRHEQLVLEPVNRTGCKYISLGSHTGNGNFPRWNTPWGEHLYRRA